MSKRKMTVNIACQPDTKKQVRDFKRGLGTTYDIALKFLLDRLREPGEDAYDVGDRLRREVPREQLFTEDDPADE